MPVLLGLLGVARAGERPSAGFWLASAAGLAAVLAFAAAQGAGLPSGGDLLVLGAVGLGAIGYAEGGALARDMGGARVICWALVLGRCRSRCRSARSRRSPAGSRPPPTPGSASPT